MAMASMLEISAGTVCDKVTAAAGCPFGPSPIAGTPVSSDGIAASRWTTRVRGLAGGTTAEVDHLPAWPDSLAQELTRQVRLCRAPARTLRLAEWIVWNLDADGYLRDDPSALGTQVSAGPAEMAQALALVQSLEPAGVGARSLRECLLLQLHAQEDRDLVAEEIIDAHMKALAEKRYADVAQALGQPVERIMRAVAAIRRLEPRPGRAFGDLPAQTIVPAATILKVGGAYYVMLRDEPASRAEVSARRWSEAAAARGEERSRLAEGIRTASHRFTAAERRRATLRAVVLSIVDRQRDFLDYGLARLRPMSFREVASDVGVHESTVSRTVAHRYVDTPHGILPLRSFFTCRLPGDPAGVASSGAARHRIREIVDAEDPASPLADGDIAQALAASGIRIARRTVVKYRDQLGIARAVARRSAVA